MAHSTMKWLALRPIAAVRADDMDAWLRTVVAPIIRKHRPGQHWSARRATEAVDGVVTFAFTVEGGAAADWDLQSILAESMSAEETRRAVEDFGDMHRGEQYGMWELAPVDLGGA